ncbi:unnamed protein product [Cylicocyclus nassatus]|uniref:Uncharacterized protein n=1 Tax=Cylicocyclus nassatus TaxID=53992 RepID=A0AA36GZF4_CYLNA|nr:unnamed protein product [Cylicocyclus nassatus]
MGLPAAGKSTLASKLLEYRPNSALFSLDEINGRWSSDFEAHKDRKAFEQKVRLHLEQKRIEEFDNWIIVDDNFYLQSMRRPFKRMARAFGMLYFCILVEIDLRYALQKNSKRGEDRVSDETIIKMSREMEIPEDALVYRSQGLEEIVKLLSQPRPKRVTKQALPSSQPSPSVLSEMDLLLRSAVSEATVRKCFTQRRNSEIAVGRVLRHHAASRRWRSSLSHTATAKYLNNGTVPRVRTTFPLISHYIFALLVFIVNDHSIAVTCGSYPAILGYIELWSSLREVTESGHLLLVAAGDFESTGSAV